MLPLLVVVSCAHAARLAAAPAPSHDTPSVLANVTTPQPVATASAVAVGSQAEPPPAAALLQQDQPLESSRPLDIERCGALTPAFETAGRCWAKRTARGHAALVFAESACTAGNCGDRVALVDDEHATARLLPGALGWNGATVVPSLRYAVVDDGARHLIRLDLSVADLARAERRHFASCGAPVLSPGGRWIVCRDQAASVLRVPVSGGRLERVWKCPYSLLRAGQTQQPVEFTSSTSMEVPVEVTGDAGMIETAPWTE
jgi:hypothetical protein